MSDKALLEFAAKAAEMDLLSDEYERWKFFPYIGVKLSNGKFWNPLTDDGDALRLAACVGVDIVFAHKGMTRVFAGGYEFTEYCGDNPYAATRRAIVRAAAEIGKAMP